MRITGARQVLPQRGIEGERGGEFTSVACTGPHVCSKLMLINAVCKSMQEQAGAGEAGEGEAGEGEADGDSEASDITSEGEPGSEDAETEGERKASLASAPEKAQRACRSPRPAVDALHNQHLSPLWRPASSQVPGK